MKVLFLFLPAALIWGCTRTLYLPAVSESTTRAATVRTDTLYVRDSIRVEPRGDTVYHTRERLVYRTAAVHDTLTVERVDTITVVPSDVDSDSRGSSGSRRSANLWRTVACVAVAIAALLLLLLRFLRR
jgi:hypothetical protein